jgi:hypothetical protein
VKNKARKRLKLLALAVIAGAIPVYLVLHTLALRPIPPPREHQAGYKAEDRQKLEQLIHEGAKND